MECFRLPHLIVMNKEPSPRKKPINHKGVIDNKDSIIVVSGASPTLILLALSFCSIVKIRRDLVEEVNEYTR